MVSDEQDGPTGGGWVRALSWQTQVKAGVSGLTHEPSKFPASPERHKCWHWLKMSPVSSITVRRRVCLCAREAALTSAMKNCRSLCQHSQARRTAPLAQREAVRALVWRSLFRLVVHLSADPFTERQRGTVTEWDIFCII